MPGDGLSNTERLYNEVAAKSIQRARLEKRGYSVSKAVVDGKEVGWSAHGVTRGHQIRGWWPTEDAAWRACAEDYQRISTLWQQEFGKE